MLSEIKPITDSSATAIIMTPNITDKTFIKKMFGEAKII
jgi:hypothetical protein